MLAVKQTIISGMIEHAGRDVPNECCGILAGAGAIISSMYRVESEQKSPRTFFMVPEKQYEAMMDIEGKGLEMMGIYHSHPGIEPRPSARDIEMAFYPDCVYFIVSVWEDREPVIRAFTIVDGEVKEEPYTIV